MCLPALGCNVFLSAAGGGYKAAKVREDRDLLWDMNLTSTSNISRVCRGSNSHLLGLGCIHFEPNLGRLLLEFTDSCVRPADSVKPDHQRITGLHLGNTRVFLPKERRDYDVKTVDL